MSSCAWADTAIDSDTFPDELFRGYVKGRFDTNNDNTLQDSEIAAAESIIVNNMGISSLEGIEIFTNLKILNCASNDLTSLDVSSLTALESLICFVNSIDVLDVTNNIALVIIFEKFIRNIA